MPKTFLATIFLEPVPDAKGWVGQCLELAEAIGCGEGVEEALSDTLRTTSEVLKADLKSGRDLERGRLLPKYEAEWEELLADKTKQCLMLRIQIPWPDLSQKREPPPPEGRIVYRSSPEIPLEDRNPCTPVGWMVKEELGVGFYNPNALKRLQITRDPPTETELFPGCTGQDDRAGSIELLDTLSGSNTPLVIRQSLPLPKDNALAKLPKGQDTCVPEQPSQTFDEQMRGYLIRALMDPEYPESRGDVLAPLPEPSSDFGAHRHQIAYDLDEVLGDIKFAGSLGIAVPQDVEATLKRKEQVMSAFRGPRWGFLARNLITVQPLPTAPSTAKLFYMEEPKPNPEDPESSWEDRRWLDENGDIDGPRGDD